MEHCPTPPRVLVGSKLDLRDDPDVLQKLGERGLSPVTTAEVRHFSSVFSLFQGRKLAKEIGARDYLETSGINKKNYLLVKNN